MDDLEEAREALSQGGTVIYPTETAYALGCDALNPEAVEKVYELKGRPRSKGLTVIVDSLESARHYADLSEKEVRAVEKLMPGPLTLVAEKKEEVPDVLNESFVFRISSSPVARELAEGPIVATSANISGGKTSYSVGEIEQSIRNRVNTVVDRGELPRGPTSTVAEINDEIKIHRKGPITRKEIEEAARK